MKHLIKIFSLIISFILLIALCSCSLFAYDNSRFDGGDTLNEELLSKIENDIQGESETGESQTSESQTSESQTSESQTGESQTGESQTSESQTSESQTSESQTTEADNEGNKDDTNTVYWTSGGTVWHTRRDCSYLKKSKNILSGTVEEAISEGKKKLCSNCEKH